MTTVVVPFRYATSPRKHAEWHTVEARTLAWLHRHQVVHSEAHEQKLLATNFAAFAAWLFPDSSRDVLQIVSDYVAAIFALDDLYDEGELSRHPDEMQKSMRQLLSGLLRCPEGKSEEPIVAVFLDVFSRIKDLSSITLANRWLYHIQLYLEANYWEASNRASGRIPREEEYKFMRRYAGAVYPVFDFIELTTREPLELCVYNDPHFVAVWEAACDVLCWSNDYFSLTKECEASDFHNIITVLQHHRGIGLPDAIREALRLHDRAYERYLSSKLRVMGEQIAPAALLSSYYHILDHLIAGHVTWAVEARRYAAPKSPTSVRGADSRRGYDPMPASSPPEPSSRRDR
jgi:(+)-eremophilene synthase